MSNGRQADAHVLHRAISGLFPQDSDSGAGKPGNRSQEQEEEEEDEELLFSQEEVSIQWICYLSARI